VGGGQVKKPHTIIGTAYMTSFWLIAISQNVLYILSQRYKMAAKIKPVEPTVIKDKKIVREVIAQVRRKPAAEDIRWAKTRRKLFNELTAK